MSITQLTSKCIYMHIVNKIATVPTAQRWFEHKLNQNKIRTLTILTGAKFICYLGKVPQIHGHASFSTGF